MSVLDKLPEEILKEYNTSHQVYALASSPEAKIKLGMGEEKEVVGKAPESVLKAEALSEDEFRDFEVYTAQINPAFMINPQTWMLGATRAMLGLKLDKITATPSISRFYYKLWDILTSLPVIPKEFVCGKPSCMVSATLGEDPGGFTQALIHYRRRFFPDQFDKDKVLGVQSEAKEQTGNEKSFLELYGANTGKIKIYHSTKNGDITQPEVLYEFVKLFAEEPADLVTADICLDMSIKDKKERYVKFSRQLFSEILATLSIQKKGGNSIIKVFLDKSRLTADLIHLVRSHYEKVVMVKPVTSIITSEEVYLVGMGFKGVSAKTLKALQGVHEKWEASEAVTSILDEKEKEMAMNDTEKLYSQFYKWQEELYERGLFLLRERQKGEKEKEMAKQEIMKKICVNIFYAVDWCVEKDVYLKGQYYLLRSPDRRPYKKDHACFEILGKKEE